MKMKKKKRWILKLKRKNSRRKPPMLKMARPQL